MRVHLLSIAHRPERGAVALTVAFVLVPVSILLAFTLDFGNAFAQRQALATSADSGALGVMVKERQLYAAKPTQSCADLVAADAALDPSSPDKASNVALAQVQANSGFGRAITAADLTTTLSCVGTSSGILQVAVRVNKTVPTTLGVFAGVSTLNVNKSATAVLGPPSAIASGYRPIGVCQYQANQILSEATADANAGVPYRAEIIALDKVWTSGSGTQTCDGGGGSGNWGWFSCDGDTPSASSLGAKLASGCTTPITLDTTLTPPSATMDGAPGNKASSTPVHDGMTAVLDTVIQLPVYDTFSGTGSGATFRVVGFISLKVCGYDVSVTGTCYDSSKPMASNEIQVRYAGSSPAGLLDSSGTLGAGGHDGGEGIIRLVG